jgi:thiamine-monophosphate kinase
LRGKGASRARRAIRRHLLPQPQVELGYWLARRRRAAAVDISDGLLLDLERLCRASQVGAIIDGARIPLDRDLDQLADELGVEALDLALTGGEDYVLLFALPAGLQPPRSLGCSEIGSLTRGRGVRVRGHKPPSVRGWDHLRAGDPHA